MLETAVLLVTFFLSVSAPAERELCTADIDKFCKDAKGHALCAECRARIDQAVGR